MRTCPERARYVFRAGGPIRAGQFVVEQHRRGGGWKIAALCAASFALGALTYCGHGPAELTPMPPPDVVTTP